MVAVALPQGQQSFFLSKLDVNGAPYTVPNAGGFVYMYQPGSTTPQTTWQDAAQTTANVDPVVLDSQGRCTIFGVGQYRQIVTDAQANVQWDQLVELGIDQTLATGALTTTPVLISGPNPNPPVSTPDQGNRPLSAVLGSFVDARNGRFGALRQGGDDLVVIQSAINYAASLGGATVYLGPGPLNTTSSTQLVWPLSASGVWLKGDGIGTTILAIAGSMFQDAVTLATGNLIDCRISDLGFHCSGTPSGGYLIHAVNATSLHLEDIRMDGSFYRGILIEGGAQQFVTVMRDIMFSNCAAANTCIQIGGDGTPAPLTTLIEACATTSAQYGIILRNVNGVVVSDTRCVSHVRGVATNPPPGLQAYDIQLTDVICNSCTDTGFYLGDAGGNTYFVVMANCWANANVLGVDIGFNPAQNNISITGCQIHASQHQGILNNGANAVLISGCLLAGNGTAATNTYDAISIGGSCLQNVVIGNFIGQAFGLPAMHRYAVTLGAGCDYCIITNNVTGSGGTGTINNASAATHNVVANNTGT